MSYGKVPLFLLALVVLLDQTSKIFADNFLITTCNSGTAFGFFQNLPLIIPILIIVGIAYFFLKENQVERRIAYALILGGGASNLIDRFTRNCVIDFIDLKVWPSFNFADSAVTIGVLLLIYKLIFNNKNSK